MARKTDPKTEKAARVSAVLSGMFKRLEARPIPEHIRAVVDQLDAADQPKLKKSG